MSRRFVCDSWLWLADHAGADTSTNIQKWTQRIHLRGFAFWASLGAAAEQRSSSVSHSGHAAHHTWPLRSYTDAKVQPAVETPPNCLIHINRQTQRHFWRKANIAQGVFVCCACCFDLSLLVSVGASFVYISARAEFVQFADPSHVGRAIGIWNIIIVTMVLVYNRENC